jgi:hypothetical protein
MISGTPNAPANARGVLLDFVNGYRVSQLVFVVAKLRIADHLKNGPLPVSELARRTEAHEESLYRVLRALASIGLFVEGKEYTFDLTATSALLRSDTPRSLRAAAEVVGEEWTWRPWGSLLHSVKTGSVAFNHVYGTSTWTWFGDHPAAEQLFNEHMAEITRAESGVITSTFPFERFGTVVDVAGGQGEFLRAILRSTRRTRGTLVERPSVIDIARASMDSEIVDRMSFVPGDLFQGLPRNGDVYVFKNVLHDWSDQEVVDILVNCRRAMRPDATVLLIEYTVDGDGSGKRKILDVQMMVRNGGRNRSKREWCELLSASEFRMLAVVETDHGPELIHAMPRA